MINTKNKNLKKYLSTFLTEFSVMILSILLYRVCLDNFGDEDFSVFSIYKRNFSFLQPLLMLGLGVGIPRYVALNFNDIKKINGFFSGATFLILFVCLISSFILFLFSNQISSIVFGSEEYSYLVTPLILMMNGVLFYNISYSLFRGRLQMGIANFMQFVFLGIVPIISLLISDSLETALYVNGILWCILSIIGWVIGFISLGGKFGIERIQIKELFLYGLYRLPGDIGLGFFFLLPVLVIVHLTGDTIVGGYVAFGITLINMVGSLFTPICVVLLAQAGNLIADKNFDTLKSITIKISRLVLGLVISGIIVFEIFTPLILEIYLGQSNESLVLVCRIIFLSSLGYGLYIALRSILDAIFVQPVNSIYILISLIVFSVICFYSVNFSTGNEIYIILYGFLFSITLLGGLTLYKTFQSINKLILRKHD